MGTIRFELRTDKLDQSGKSPFRAVYQIKGQRKYFPTTIKCFPFNWSTKLQQAIPADKKTLKKDFPKIDPALLLTASEINDINSKLQELRREIEKVETRFTLDNITYSPQMVIDALKENLSPKEKRDDPTESVASFITKYVSDSSATHKEGTLKVYTGLANHILAFEKAYKFKLTFNACNAQFMRSFHAFLTKDKASNIGADRKIQKGMNNITAAKQLSTLKTILRAARTMYKIGINDEYQDFKISRTDGDFEIIALTMDEFETVYNMDLSDKPRLDQVRDVFCFSCATGLRYSDLSQLKWEHIRKDMSIKMTTAKGSQKMDIPLNPYSAAILEKYKGHARPLPVISGQKTNDYIKEIGELAGIDTPIVKTRKYGVKVESITFPKYQLLSIHCGRKTFISLSLEKGIAAQVVMKMSGHRTWAAFRRYADVADQHKRDEMARAWGEIKAPNPLKKAE